MKSESKKKLPQPTPNFEKGCSNELPPNVMQQCKDAGFKGEPVVAVKYINKLHPPIGNRDHDIDAGNVAYMVGEKLIISEHIGKGYFETNFLREEEWQKLNAQKNRGKRIAR